MMKRFVTAVMFVAALMLPDAAEAKNLSINGHEYEVDTLVYKHKVGPGVEYARYRLPERPLDIFVLETDLSNPYVTFEVWDGNDQAIAKQCPSDRYKKEDRPGHDMIAAHNGDFYTVERGREGMSRMGLIGVGDVIFNPTGKPLFVIDGDNRPYIDNVNFRGILSAGDASARIHTVNQLWLEWEHETAANQLSLFTPAFGDTIYGAVKSGKLAVIRPVDGALAFPANKSLNFTVTEICDNPGGYKIPVDGAVLYGKGTSASFLEALSPGEQVTLNLGVWMPNYPAVTTFREAVGGSGDILMRDGKICHIENREIHPRTFMGISEDGTLLYHVVVDGRSEFSAGIELEDEGRLLEWLGAWHGINLDGGGSSCMVVNGDIVNRTSDGNERAVGNGAIIYSTAPGDDEITEIAFAPTTYSFACDETLIPVVYGYNKYGLLKNSALEGITVTCDPQIGTIDSNGRFVAGSAPAKGYLYATYNGITTRREIVIH